MSPELRAEFEARWPELSVRLDRFLANRKVSPSARDDLIQETAIRLLGMWSSVDRARSPWPLTVTIALNLLRDDGRAARNREISGDLPESVASAHHVEAAGMARVELERVATALAELPALQRAALMREVGIEGVAFATREAEKMLRLRARKRLRSILERVSGILILRPRRDAAEINTALIARDGLTQVAACLACAVLGIAAGVVPGVVAAPPATAHPRTAFVTTGVTGAAGHRAPALDVRRAAQMASLARGDRQADASRTRGDRVVRPSAPAATVPAATPLPEDVPLQPPALEPPTVAPPATEPPSLPGVPPVSPPQGDDSPLDPGAVVDDVLGTVGTD